MQAIGSPWSEHSSGNPCLEQAANEIANGFQAAGNIAVAATIVGGVTKAAARSAAEMHHLLPQAKRFKKFFERAGLNIEDFKIPLDKATHRLKPGGIHTKGGGDWNNVWDNFFKENPNATRTEILEQLARMRSDFGV